MTGTRHRLPPLVVSCIATFSMRWLMPRLHQFKARYPDIDIHLCAPDSPVVCPRDDITMSIRTGRSNWPEDEAIIPTPRQQGVDGDEAKTGTPSWSWARLLGRVFVLIWPMRLAPHCGVGVGRCRSSTCTPCCSTNPSDSTSRRRATGVTRIPRDMPGLRPDRSLASMACVVSLALRTALYR